MFGFAFWASTQEIAADLWPIVVYSAPELTLCRVIRQSCAPFGGDAHEAPSAQELGQVLRIAAESLVVIAGHWDVARRVTKAASSTSLAFRKDVEVWQESIGW